MPQCPVCKRAYGTQPVRAIRLFQSQNECPICLEKKSEMMALPCGHQFCKADLRTLGFLLKKPKPPARRRRVFSEHAVRRRIVRSTAVRPMHTIRRRREFRCGWCGHLGHTIRKCRVHRRECNCRTFKTTQHRAKHKAKRRCSSCGRKGHVRRSCFRRIVC